LTSWSVFFVRAHTEAPTTYYDFDPDSGYSVDNLAPAVPKGLIANVYADSTVLTWKPNPEEDLAYYAIYRGSCPDFIPDAPLGYTIDTTYTDPIVGYCYKISAFDFAGNESDLAGAEVVEETAIQPALPMDFPLAQNHPNPFNSSTELKYSLSKYRYVKLEIYDISGRRIATLVDEDQQAGYKSVRWDASSFSSGIYFYRLKAGGFVQTREMVRLK